MRTLAKVVIVAFFVIIMFSACLIFISNRLGSTTDAPNANTQQSCSEQVERLQKQLKRHGNLDRLVRKEAIFTKAQNKSNSEFFRDNVKHLEAICDSLRDVIFRKKGICQSLTQEYALVKEQLMLMQDGKISQPDYELAKENYEKLSQVVQQLSKITEQEQDAFLMWENIKRLRKEQLQFVNKIQEKELYAGMTKPSEEEDGNAAEHQKMAWKK